MPLARWDESPAWASFLRKASPCSSSRADSISAAYAKNGDRADRFRYRTAPVGGGNESESAAQPVRRPSRPTFQGHYPSIKWTGFLENSTLQLTIRPSRKRITKSPSSRRSLALRSKTPSILCVPSKLTMWTCVSKFAWCSATTHAGDAPAASNSKRLSRVRTCTVSFGIMLQTLLPRPGQSCCPTRLQYIQVVERKSNSGDLSTRRERPRRIQRKFYRRIFSLWFNLADRIESSDEL